jgi:hypothetical protein
MFVRKRKSGNQLLESYRDEHGKVKQRVIANLGPHESPAAALEALRGELEALGSERIREAEQRVAVAEARIKAIYGEGLDEWHDGEIPPLAEVLEKAREAALSYKWGGTDAWDDYADSFASYDEEGEPVELDNFIWSLRKLKALREEERGAWGAIEPKASNLRERIGILEAVVSK